jgi:hypothetical protein
MADSTLDHLVVAARSLEEGAAWVEARLAVKMANGGRHALMGTHNRLLRLDAGRYLEVIAIDPEAPGPRRPRWFELDSPSMKSRLAKGPALIHWVERTGDLEAALGDDRNNIEILELSRGPYRWRMGVPRDGRLPGGGTRPTLIQWEGGVHPWDGLPETGVSLLEFRHGSGPLSATFVTPAGPRTMP